MFRVTVKVCFMLRSFLSRSAVLALSVAAIPSVATAQEQPFPGRYCQAEVVVNGDRWLYRTSFIKAENLRVDGQPIEVDLLRNGEYEAHAWTRFTDNFTFTGATGTGTPLLFRLNPATGQIRVVHAGRVAFGDCGDLPTDI